MALQRLACAFQNTPLSSFRCSPYALQQLSDSCRNVWARLYGDGAYLDKNVVAERVVAAVKHFDKVDANKVSTKSTFKDLGLDSLDTVEVVMAMEEDFCVEIPDSEADKIDSVPAAIEYFSAHPHAK